MLNSSAVAYSIGYQRKGTCKAWSAQLKPTRPVQPFPVNTENCQVQHAASWSLPDPWRHTESSIFKAYCEASVACLGPKQVFIIGPKFSPWAELGWASPEVSYIPVPAVPDEGNLANPQVPKDVPCWVTLNAFKLCKNLLHHPSIIQTWQCLVAWHHKNLSHFGARFGAPVFFSDTICSSIEQIPRFPLSYMKHEKGYKRHVLIILRRYDFNLPHRPPGCNINLSLRESLRCSGC